MKPFLVSILALLGLISSAHAATNTYGLNAGLNFSPVLPSGLSGGVGVNAGGHIESHFHEVFGYQGFVEFQRATYKAPATGLSTLAITNILKVKMSEFYVGTGAQVTWPLNSGHSSNLNLAISTGMNIHPELFVDLRAATDFDDLFNAMLMSAQVGFRL